MIYSFVVVGIDYFGSFYVYIGFLIRFVRKNFKFYKRYGCIFICFRYRVVYIEFVSDLIIDSFINVVIRFVVRRGFFRVIYSDNGINFRGVEIDVVNALKIWE